MLSKLQMEEIPLYKANSDELLELTQQISHKRALLPHNCADWEFLPEATSNLRVASNWKCFKFHSSIEANKNQLKLRVWLFPHPLSMNSNFSHLSLRQVESFFSKLILSKTLGSKNKLKFF